MSDVQFHIYVDGEPTRTVENSFQAAKNAAVCLIASRRAVRIQTAGSVAPVAVWEFDYSIDGWVRQL